MGRPCTCLPACRRCNAGKCDCVCSSAELRDYDQDEYRRDIRKRLTETEAQRYEELAKKVNKWNPPELPNRMQF